jgi:hypothetical protein
VYDHQPADIGGGSPVITVHSDGTEAHFGGDGYNPHAFYFWISIYVLRIDPGTAWEEAGAEDILDTIEHDVREWIVNHAGPTYNATPVKVWDTLIPEPGAVSEAGYLVIGKEQYRTERFRVVAMIKD